MITKSAKIRLVLLVGLVLTACSPSFTSPTLMPAIEIEPQAKTVKTKPMFYLQEVGDLRSDKSFLKIGKQDYSTHADVGPVVRESLSKVLVDSGFVYSNAANLVFKLDVIKWNSNLSDDFLSELKSTAEIQLTLFDRSGRKVYSGKYLGESVIEHLTHDNENLLKCLGLAMKQAILKIAQDPGLLKLIEGYNAGSKG